MKQVSSCSRGSALQKTLHRASLIVRLLALALVAFAAPTPKFYLKESTGNYTDHLLYRGGKK